MGPSPAGTCPPSGLALRLKFVGSPRGGAIGPQARALCLLPEAPQEPLQSPSPGLGGPSWDRSCPLDTPVRRGHPGAEGLEEGEGLLTPPPGEFHSLLTPVFTQLLSHNLCPSVSRSFCGSLPPSSPGTTDTGPQPSDLGGHRASLIPCPSLTPGG